MQLHSAVPKPVAPASLRAAHRSDAGWDDVLAHAADGHVLVIGHDTLELTCALIRLGCPAVEEMSGEDRCPRREAETVIVPRVATSAAAERAIALAARALVPTGQLVLELTAPATLLREVERLLGRYGFTGIRLATGAGLHVSAVLPMFGPLLRPQAA